MRPIMSHVQILPMSKVTYNRSITHSLPGIKTPGGASGE